MRSFGTLYEPQRSKRKCSEELRSRSIDWRGQTVLRLREKFKKGHIFLVWETYWQRRVVDTQISVGFVLQKDLKAQISSSNFFFVIKIFRNFIFCSKIRFIFFSNMRKFNFICDNFNIRPNSN